MKRLSIIIAIALFAATACEDFLTKYPSDQVVADQAILTVQDAGIALNGVYSGFKSTAYYGRYFVAHADVQTDELQSVIGYSNQLGEFYKWSFLSDNGEITGAWDIMYKVIVRASNLIDALPSIEDGDEATLKKIEAEARLARAMAHFDLVKAFGKAYTEADPNTDLGVPIVTSFVLAKPERNTLAEVYKFIRDESLLAKNALDTADVVPSTAYFNKASAAALLARVSLYMGEWEDAVRYATEVIDYSEFALETDSAGLANMYLTDEGNEIIFKIGLTRGDYDGRYIGYNYYDNSQGPPSSDYIPAEWIINAFGPGDYRDEVIFKSDSTKYGWAWPLVWKYPGNPAFYNTEKTTNANMHKVFRLAEMYLIRAEAFAEQDLDGLALTDYNTLRRARIAGYTDDETLSGQALKNAIWEERQRELCFEGHQLWDLKRKGLGFTRAPIVHPDQGQITNPGPSQNQLSVDPSDDRWQWPIPDNELRANPNITPNPGY